MEISIQVGGIRIKAGVFDIKKAPELSYARNINILLINYLYVCFFISRMVAKVSRMDTIKERRKRKSDVIRWIFPNSWVSDIRQTIYF